MSTEMRFYIVGKTWNSKGWSEVKSYFSNVIKYSMDGIDSMYSCPDKEAEKLIEDFIRSEYSNTDDEFDKQWCETCVQSLRYLSLDNVRRYLEDLKKDLNARREEKKTLEENRYKCASKEVYEAVSDDILFAEGSIKEYEQEISTLEYFLNGMSYLLNEYFDFNELDGNGCPYVIGYTIL